jgi:hypothetical protein
MDSFLDDENPLCFDKLSAALSTGEIGSVSTKLDKGC